MSTTSTCPAQARISVVRIGTLRHHTSENCCITQPEINSLEIKLLPQIRYHLDDRILHRRVLDAQNFGRQRTDKHIRVLADLVVRPRLACWDVGQVGETFVQILGRRSIRISGEERLWRGTDVAVVLACVGPAGDDETLTTSLLQRQSADVREGHCGNPTGCQLLEGRNQGERTVVDIDPIPCLRGEVGLLLLPRRPCIEPGYVDL